MKLLSLDGTSLISFWIALRDHWGELILSNREEARPTILSVEEADLLLEYTWGSVAVRNTFANYRQGATRNDQQVPVWDRLANYRQGATPNDQQDVLATLQRNEDPPWRFLGESLNPAPPPPNYVKVLEQDPRPPPPNTFYQQHMMPYYVLQYPGRGGSYAYGQRATYPRYIQAGGQLLPHSGYGGSGFLPVSQYQLPPVVPQSNPKGDQRRPIQAQKFHSSSSESSSKSDGD